MMSLSNESWLVMSESHPVYVWQEPGSPSLVLPAEFNVVPVVAADLPVDAPILVRADAWESFAGAAEHMLPDAILYLQKGQPQPQGSVSYFDAVVYEGDWQALKQRTHLSEGFQVAVWASDLPASLLDRLPHLLQHRDLSRLPLPVETQDLLRRNTDLLAAFNAAIERERAIRWATIEPSPQMLADYLQGRLSTAVAPYIEDYLARSPIGHATFNVLKDKLLGKLVEARFHEDDGRVPRPPTRDQAGMALMLLAALLRAHFVRYSSPLKSESPEAIPFEAGQLLQQLLDGKIGKP